MLIDILAASEDRRVSPAQSGHQIRVVSQDSKLDLTNGGVDIAIRYGVPPFNDGIVLGSCGDRIYPVCSPHYATSRRVEDFPHGGYELIETDVPNRSWYR
ncbi:hypothetical protein HJA95_05860 [Rhizobium binae]|uniref:hypothetical protein n=1 Tax=Rhizobium binae TaxID=1138190 RepID=UPI001C83C2CC|nr:hypothetical protein [Rhizobium binae]MBX4949121.1 hypothetical protein [Rhizobium binae]